MRAINLRGVMMLDHQVGQKIDKYRLVRKLGSGGFGTVYLAEHVREHTQVAVKVLHVPQTSDEDLKGFINEARAIELSHPHIMPLLSFGISRKQLPFLVMEYAPEGTLRDRHPTGARIALSTIVSYVDQIASALQYAHDHQVIHRDVKPANILIRTNGTLMVGDFGIAKFLEQSVFVSPQTQVGTPLYMAPEQYEGYPCFASDQYALAVIIYQWICGVSPFRGTALGLAVQHMTTSPPQLRDHLPELPESVEHVILKALSKVPEDRFECVQDMASALREAVQSSIVLNPPIESMNTVPFIPSERLSGLVSRRKPQANAWGQWLLSRRAMVGGVTGIVTAGSVVALVRSQWLPLFSTSSPRATHDTPQIGLPSPTQTPELLEGHYIQFTVRINNVEGLLSNSTSSPEAEDIKQQIKNEPNLKNRSVGLAMVYGGTGPGNPPNTQLGYDIAHAIYGIMDSMKDDPTFTGAAFGDDLYYLYRSPSVATIQAYLFKQ